jgi:hypothetical protein
LDEVLVVGGISLIPLIFKLVVRLYHGKDGHILGFSDALTSVLRECELLFLAVGLIASVIWISAQDFDLSRFDERIWFISLSIIGIAICVFFIEFNPDLNVLPDDLVRNVSGITFLYSCIMYFLKTVFAKHELSYFPRALKKGENIFIAKLKYRKRDA